MIASVRHLVELVDDRSLRATIHWQHFISDRLLINRLVVAISLKSVYLKCVRRQRTATLFALYTAVSQRSFIFFYLFLLFSFISTFYWRVNEHRRHVKCRMFNQSTAEFSFRNLSWGSCWVTECVNKYKRRRAYAWNAAKRGFCRTCILVKRG